MRSQVERIIRLHENEIFFFVCGAFSDISANMFDVIIFIIFFTDASFRKGYVFGKCLAKGESHCSSLSFQSEGFLERIIFVTS